MFFDKTAYDNLRPEDFILPPPTFYFESSLSKQKLFIGLPKWSDMADLMPYIKEKQSREEYSKIFNVVELNSTHYTIFGEESMNTWLQSLHNPDFLFCPQMYKGITRRGPLEGKEELMVEFCKSISYFGKKLGPVFIHFHENFTPTRKEELYAFLLTLPLDKFDFFFDFRYTGWFTDAELLKELSQKFHELDIGLVIADKPINRQVMHMQMAVKKAFIRFYGVGNEPLDYYRIDYWSEQLKLLANKGVETVFFILHLQDQHSIPEFYNYVVKKFSKGEKRQAGLKFFPPQPPIPKGMDQGPKFKS